MLSDFTSLGANPFFPGLTRPKLRKVSFSGWPAHRTRSFATLLRLTSVQMLVLLLADLSAGRGACKAELEE